MLLSPHWFKLACVESSLALCYNYCLPTISVKPRNEHNWKIKECYLTVAALYINVCVCVCVGGEGQFQIQSPQDYNYDNSHRLWELKTAARNFNRVLKSGLRSRTASLFPRKVSCRTHHIQGDALML